MIPFKHSRFCDEIKYYLFPFSLVLLILSLGQFLLLNICVSLLLPSIAERRQAVGQFI